MCEKCRSYGERHEYVKVNGKKHYVIHPRKTRISVHKKGHHYNIGLKHGLGKIYHRQIKPMNLMQFSK